MKNVLLLLMFIIIACGYEMPEEDKHQGLPVFPKHTHSEYEINPLPYKHALRVGEIDNKYFLFCNNSKGTQGNLILLNKDFKELKRHSITPHANTISLHYELDTSANTIYFINSGFSSYDDKMFKYVYPGFKEEPLKYINIDSIQGVVYKELDGADNKSGDFLDQSVIDSITYLRIEKEYFKNVQYLINWNWTHYSIIKNKDGRDLYITNYGDNKLLNKILGKYKVKTFLSNTENRRLPEKENLVQFDRAVLGNTSSGNHMVFGFHSYGYLYYHIFMGKDTISFKFADIHNTVEQVTTYDKKAGQLILFSEAENRYYSVVKK